MEKYIKKPIIVEAIQFTEEMYYRYYNIEKNPKENPIDVQLREIPAMKCCWNTYTKKFEIRTLEGSGIVSINDYIIKGVEGEYYPCKPDIFEMAYSKLDKITKNEIHYNIAVRAKILYIQYYSDYLCECFRVAIKEQFKEKTSYEHPLFKYENALKFNAKRLFYGKDIGKIGGDWWHKNNRDDRINFLEWIILNSCNL